MRIKKFSLPYLFLTIITFGLAIQLFLYLFPNPNLTVISFQQYPEEYMSHVSLTQFSKQGEPQNQLIADYWGYISTEKKSQLIQPHLTIHKEDGAVWKINAKQGYVHHPKLHEKIEKIELRHSVIIERLANQKITPLKLETSALEYQPAKEYLSTEKMVTVTKPNIILTAIGLRAFFAKNWIELLSNVNTKYITQP